MLTRAKLLTDLHSYPELVSFLEPLVSAGSIATYCFHAKELEDPAVLRVILEGFAAKEGFAHGDKKAIASLWSRWYFGLVLPPLLVASTTCLSMPRLEKLWLTADFRPCRLQWVDPIETFSVVSPNAIRKAIESFVEGFMPLIRILAENAKVSPKVFWSNLGNLVEYWVGQLQGLSVVQQSVVGSYKHYLEAPRFLNGEPNPLFEPVRYLSLCGDQAHITRIRKICCLYYLLPGTELCSNCPRLKQSSRHVSA